MTTFTFSDLIQRGSLIIGDGYRTKASELGPQGLPILRVAEVGDGTISPAFGDQVREEFRTAIGLKVSRPGDVLLTTKGTVGRRAIMPRNEDEYAYSPQLCFFRVRDSSIDNRWLDSGLGSQAVWRHAASVSTQPAMAPYISLRDLRAMRIHLPPVEEQRGIAATLGALDDKIESNNRASSNAVLLAQQLLSRPGRRVRTGDIAKLQKGLSYKGAGLRDSDDPGAKPMFNLGNFTTTGMHKPTSLKHYAGGFKEKHLLRSGALVIANTDLTQARDLLGRGFLVPPEHAGALHTHHTSVVMFDEGSDAAPFLWAQLQGQEFRDRALGFATGTTVSALPAEAILDFEFELPDKQEAVREQALPLIQLSWTLQRQSASTRALRDTLLPELFSRRIRVPEAREAVEEAVS